MATQPVVNADIFASGPPRSAEEWRHLEFSITDIFSPHAPIDDTTLFAGRHALMRRLIDTVFQKGRHATLYGERGVGKTSLANIIKDQVFSKTTVKVIKRSCTQTHDFRLMWQHAFDEFQIEGQSSKDFVGPDVNPYDVYKIVELLPPNNRPVFIFDEFDRIRDKSVFPMMADTIKYLADYGSRATVIIVGVADNVTELFGGHPSIQRNVQQIKMPRMSTEELEAIFDRRMKLLGMYMNEKVRKLIVDLSQGLPTYTHLMGQNAALCAARRSSVEITTIDFEDSIEVCIEEADETVKETYLRAVRSSKPSNKYKEVLLACAMAKTNEKGYFNAAAVGESYSRIRGRKVGMPYFSRHLTAFCEEERGPALIRTGAEKSYEYRFLDPLVRPYAMICGMAEKLI